MQGPWYSERRQLELHCTSSAKRKGRSAAQAIVMDGWMAGSQVPQSVLGFETGLPFSCFRTFQTHPREPGWPAEVIQPTGILRFKFLQAPHQSGTRATPLMSSHLLPAERKRAWKRRDSDPSLDFFVRGSVVKIFLSSSGIQPCRCEDRSD